MAPGPVRQGERLRVYADASWRRQRAAGRPLRPFSPGLLPLRTPGYEEPQRRRESDQHDCYRRPNRQTLTILSGFTCEPDMPQREDASVACVL